MVVDGYAGIEDFVAKQDHGSVEDGRPAVVCAVDTILLRVALATVI